MAGASVTPKARAKTIKTACRSCGKARRFENLDMTHCCNNLICDEYVDYGKRLCHPNHREYSRCYLHFSEQHEGKWQDCEECIEMRESSYDFDEVTCVSCGFKSTSMSDFTFQLNEDFYCEKDECQTKVKPPLSKTTKVKRVVVKEVKKACRLCRKSSKLIKTNCCNNWICDDSHKYVMFSYAFNSCDRNHRRYSRCSYHYNENHEGKWQDCEICEKLTLMSDDFDDVTCVSCGFKSDRIEKFAFKINKDFYCKKDECQRKTKVILDSIKWTPKRKVEDKEASGPEAKKAKVVCRICEKSRRLTRTKCCNSWVWDRRSYGFFSNPICCLKSHEKYSCCAFHHSQGHEGKAQDCEICKKRDDFKFDFDDFETSNSNFEQENVDVKNIPKKTFICSGCIYKSETDEAFASVVRGYFFCPKDECQEKYKARPY